MIARASESELRDYSEIRNFLKRPVILFRCPRLCTNSTIGLVYDDLMGRPLDRVPGGARLTLLILQVTLILSLFSTEASAMSF